MGLLRFLLSLPLLLLRGVGWVLQQIFGRVAWQPVGWQRAVGRGTVRVGNDVRQRPGRAIGILVAVLAIGAGSWYGYKAWRDRPKPIQEAPSAMKTHAPLLTGYDETERKPIVHPLRIDFTRSTAPIALVGKQATAGITLKPELAGTWTWLTDRELDFQPRDDWPVGQNFSVRFDPKLAFAEHVKVDKDETTFASAPFKATVASGEFYQDPTDATAKKAVIQVGFTHPVDTVSFEKGIALKLSQPKNTSVAKKVVVSYDERKVNAFIHSEPLTIPTDDEVLNYSIDASVHAARGGPAIEKALEGSVAVPGLYSLKIADISATLVDNARFEPEQVLLVDASQSVNERDAAHAVTAWLLPKFNPKTPEDERGDVPYQWGDSEIDEALLKGSQKLVLEAIPAEHDYAELQSFKYHADTGRYLYVRVEKGLKSFGGYVLGKPATQVVQVPEYPRMLKFMADGALLSLSGEKRVAVIARNVPGMELEVARVLPDQLQHLVAFNRGSYAKPQLYSLSPDQITERFVQKIPFGETDPGKAHFEGAELGKYFSNGANARHGVFLLKLAELKPEAKKAEVDPNAEEPDNSDDSGAANEGEMEGEGQASDGTIVGDSRLIVVTDLGMITKRSLDGSQDVYVQSIKGGVPVEGANVDVVGKNGQTLVTRATDATGHVHFDPLDGMTREKTPAMFVVRKGDDLSFLPIGEHDRALDFSRFDIGGERNAKNAGRLTAYLFSDRGIYRPGDTFHVGVVVRAADWTKPLDGIPLVATITDARGSVVEQRKLRLDTAGFLAVDHTTQESAPTGSWNVNIYIVKDGKADVQIGSTSVQIKEFLPDRMKADAKLSQSAPDGWVKPENLKALLTLQNLFGTPAQDRRVEATLTLSPSVPSFRGYADYHFFDPQRAKEGYTDALGERKTNDKGEAEFPLDLTKYVGATYQLRFFAKGYEAEGGRSVAAETRQLISSLDYLIGAKTDGALDFVQRGAKRSVNLIAIDPNAKKTAVADLKLAVIERRYVSILTKQESGVYKYESKAKDVLVSETPLKIAAAGNDVPLPTDKPGSYALVVRNGLGDELNRVEYSVAGEANLTRSLERNAELQLALSKHDYAPGEDIEIAIRAPYAGNGLITIERDKVYAHQWFKAATSGSVQKITVPKDFEGNGYINVQFVRDPSSDEIFMSPLSYGVVPFSVNRDARRDVLTVDVPTLVKPGDTLTMKANVAQSARIAVFAVDEGILQVARYKLGDPLDFFFRKRMLDVKTSQILDLILPEFSKLISMAAPGGDADDLLSRHLNPFKKKHQQPVAYWSGIVDIKDHRDFTWTVPDDFNGKLRVMAVAVRADRIGIVQNSTTVRGDFVLSPNVPGMVAPGDEVRGQRRRREQSHGPRRQGSADQGHARAIGRPRDHRRRRPGDQARRDARGRARLQVARERDARRREARLQGGIRRQGREDRHRSLGAACVCVSHRPHCRRSRQGQRGHQAAARHARRICQTRCRRVVHAARTRAGTLGLSRRLPASLHRAARQPGHARPRVRLASRIRTDQDRRQQERIGCEIRGGAAGLVRRHALAPERRGRLRPVDSDASFGALRIGLCDAVPDRGEGARSAPAGRHARCGQQVSVPACGRRKRRFAGRPARTRVRGLSADAPGHRDDELPRRRAEAPRRQLARTWHDDLAAAYLAASLKLLKQDKEADRLIDGPQKVLTRAVIENAYRFARYYDPLVRDATMLYLIARHFPNARVHCRRRRWRICVRPIQRGWYNTLSSATDHPRARRLRRAGRARASSA